MRQNKQIYLLNLHFAKKTSVVICLFCPSKGEKLVGSEAQGEKEKEREDEDHAEHEEHEKQESGKYHHQILQIQSIQFSHMCANLVC